MRRFLLWSGILLLALSLLPMIHWIQEEIYLHTMQKNYLLHSLTQDQERLRGPDAIFFKDQRITLHSDWTKQIHYNYEGRLHTIGEVEIASNGHVFHTLKNWPIHDEKQGLTRYLTGMEMVHVLDKTGDEFLAIIIQPPKLFQQVTTTEGEGFTLIRLYPDGTSEEEHLTLEEATWFQAYLAEHLASQPSGYYSQLPYVHPFIALLYPFFPFLYGMSILLMLSLRQLVKRYRPQQVAA